MGGGETKPGAASAVTLDAAFAGPAGPPPAAWTDLSPGTLVAGRYRIGKRLGVGGTGLVFTAHDLSTDEIVAMKLLRHDPRASAGDHAERFRRELRAARKVTHPRAVRLHDILELDDGTVALTMEYIEGESLDAALARAPRWAAERLLRLASDLASALSAAHGVGIVHRDLKPANVLLRASDDAALIADFGVSRVESAPEPASRERPPTSPGIANVTMLGSLIGTPLYMAPEQLAGETAHACSDVFALGLILHEAATGQAPHAGAGNIVDLVDARKVASPPLRSLRPDLPRGLCDVVDRCLAVDPAGRFVDGSAVVAALQALDRPERGRRRLRWAAAIAGLAAATIAALQASAGATCRNAAEHLVGVWDETRAGAVERALLTTGGDFAEATAARVRQGLDAYAADWTEMHTRACEAHRDGERSSAALDLQMYCLQRRRAEVAALVDVLDASDAATAASAVQAVAGLRPIASCGDPTVLMNEQRRLGLPSDPAAATQVQQLRRKLAQVEALFLAGQLDHAVALADETIRAAQSLPYLPIVAEAQFWRGRILADTSAMTESASVLWSAYLTSVRTGHEAIELWSLVIDVHVQGYGLRDVAAAFRSAAIARALIARTAPDVAVQSEFYNNLANVHTAQGQLIEAEQLYNAGLALHRQTEPRDGLRMGVLLVGLGDNLRLQGRLAESEPLLREATSVFDSYLGPEHPFKLTAEANLALCILETGDIDRGREMFERTFPALLTAFGDRPDFAEFYAASGALHLARGAVTEALADLEHAHDLAAQLGQPTLRGHTYFNLARALWDHAPAQRERALALARQAERAAAIYSPRHHQRIVTWLAAREAPPR